jgi:hypothetical protein
MIRGVLAVRWLLATAIVTALAIASQAAGAGLDAGLPYLLPAVLLLLALARRRYPGERVLLAFMEPRRRRLRRRSIKVAPRACRLRTLLPRGGRLIAFSLAVRPPPARRPVSLTC